DQPAPIAQPRLAGRQPSAGRNDRALLRNHTTIPSRAGVSWCLAGLSTGWPTGSVAANPPDRGIRTGSSARVFHGGLTDLDAAAARRHAAAWDAIGRLRVRGETEGLSRSVRPLPQQAMPGPFLLHGSTAPELGPMCRSARARTHSPAGR